MKKERALILISLFITGWVTAQEDLGTLPVVDGYVSYTNVVEVPSANKDELFARARKWFALSYKSANDVVQLTDKESGELVGKGNFTVVWLAYTRYIGHTISISVKDNKFKYVINNFRLISPEGNIDRDIENLKGIGGRGTRQNLFAKMDAEVKRTIASLESAMRSQLKHDDW